jgi:hypothetical protein
LKLRLTATKMERIILKGSNVNPCRWSVAATSVALLILSSEATRAQVPSQQDNLTCHQSGSGNNGTRNLPNGGSIAIRTVPANELKQTCDVSVRDRSGRTIFEDRGFNTKIDPATGRDIDNDGQPDAVVGVDTTGGTYGNWEYPVISFAPTARLLLKLPPATFDFQTKPGKTLIWTSAIFEGLGQNTADISTVATVHEFRPTGFVDVTPDYCKPMLSGELQGPGSLRGQLAILTRQAKQDSRLDAGRPEDREDTRLAATTIVLQQIYCGQVEDASRLVLEVWPGSDQSRIRRQIRDAIADRWPELARQLGTWN